MQSEIVLIEPLIGVLLNAYSRSFFNMLRLGSGC
jgi:hypothetical protein